MNTCPSDWRMLYDRKFHPPCLPPFTDAQAYTNDAMARFDHQQTRLLEFRSPPRSDSALGTATTEPLRSSNIESNGFMGWEDPGALVLDALPQGLPGHFLVGFSSNEEPSRAT